MKWIKKRKRERGRGTIFEYYISKLLKEQISRVESQQIGGEKPTTSLPVIIKKMRTMGIKIEINHIRSEGKYIDFLYKIKEENKEETKKILRSEGFYWII